MASRAAPSNRGPAAGASRRPGLAVAFEGAVTGLVSWSVARRRLVLTMFLLAGLVAIPGVLRLEVHNRMTEWVDPDDPGPAAFMEGIEALPGIVNFERVLLTYEGSDPDGLMAPASLRDQERLQDLVLGRLPGGAVVMSPARIVQLTAYELAVARGEQPEDARLPERDEELDLAIRAARQTQGPVLGYLLADNGRLGTLAFTFDAAPFSLEASVQGGVLSDAVVAAFAEGGFRTLSAEHAEPLGVASVNAHINDILSRDLVLLGALGLALVFVLLWAAARRLSAVVGGFVSLLLGLVLTLGTLGWLGIPFNLLNLPVLPLIMGNGIDYSIHVLAEAGDGRRRFGKGLGRHLGRSLGVPVVLVTLTTVIGLGTLAFSSSPYLGQMGLLSGAAIALIAFLSLTFLPAYLATFDGGRSGNSGNSGKSGDRDRDGRSGGTRRRWTKRWAPAPFLAAGRFGRRRPLLLAALVVLPAAAGAWAFATMDYEVDLLSGSLPADDPLIVNQRIFEEEFATDNAWFIHFSGNVVSEESWAFQDRLVDILADQGLIASANESFTLPDLARGHHRQRSVPGGLGAILPDPVGPAVTPPATPDEMVDGLAAEEPYKPLLGILADAERRVGALYLLPPEADRAVATTDRQRDEFVAAVAAAQPPEDMDVQVYSFKLLARDFMGESQASLQILYVVSLASTLALFYLATHDRRATLIVALPVFLSSLWWFGLLKLSLGSIGVYQLISLVFITSIGSDYAAYLVYKYRDTGDWEGTLRGTGRAVLFSALTDAGAFLVFSLTSVRSGGDMLLGAALAIMAILGATLAVVPALLHRVRGRVAATPAGEGRGSS